MDTQVFFSVHTAIMKIDGNRLCAHTIREQIESIGITWLRA